MTIRISIAARMRKYLAMTRGKKLHAIEYRGRIRLLPVSTMKSARGFLRGLDTDVPRDADRV